MKRRDWYNRDFNEEIETWTNELSEEELDSGIRYFVRHREHCFDFIQEYPNMSNRAELVVYFCLSFIIERLLTIKARKINERRRSNDTTMSNMRFNNADTR